MILVDSFTRLSTVDLFHTLLAMDNNNVPSNPPDLISSNVITENVNGNSGGDEPDARIGSLINSLTGRQNHGNLSVHPQSLDYMMVHPSRGKCIIFNNKKFEPQTQLHERKGTDKDAEALTECFQSFDFECSIINDAGARQVSDKLRVLSRLNYSDCDCLVVCVLSHGEQGMIWGRDQRYPVDELYRHFTGEKCPSLAGKPKLFFIQACQGSNFDRGVVVQSNHDTTDGAQYYKIPTWADILIMYSTVPGYYSWRNPTQGSWFVQALVSIMKEHSNSLDLLSMLTLVNRKVAYEFESFCPGQVDFDKNKQVPCITSMLTRRVFFPPRA